MMTLDSSQQNNDMNRMANLIMRNSKNAIEIKHKIAYF